MKLTPEDYWKLRSVQADLERDQAALMTAQVRLTQAQRHREQVWQEMVLKYELDPTARFAMTDEDCSLTVQA